MKIRPCIGFILIALLLGLLFGCRVNPPRNESPYAIKDAIKYTDGIGRTVLINARPQRIVSLAPSITETLFALGLGDRVVAVTSYCDYPAEAKLKDKIGDTLRPDIERIIALKPDLIIITTASQLEMLTGKLEELHIPVYVTNPRKVRDVIASIRELGNLTGEAAKAREIADEMQHRVDAVGRRVKDLPSPRVLYVLQANPLITAGRDTFINDLIGLAGGKSISSDEPADYPQFSRETVLARAPEIIVTPAVHGTDLVSEKDLRRDFALTPAIRLNRIVRVNPDWIDRPGPRIVDGLEQLAQGLHPESP